MNVPRRAYWSCSIALLLLSSIWFSVSATRSNIPLPPAAAVESIHESDLRQHVEFLASDELGGRYTFSPSNSIVARYLASRLRNYGFRGGAEDGSFFQKFELVTQQFNPDESFIEVQQGQGTMRFLLGKYADLSGSYGEADVQGELVLVPSNVAMTLDDDDVDLHGKIAVVPVPDAEEKSSQGSASRSWRQGSSRLVRDITQVIRQRGALGGIILFKTNKAKSQAAGPRPSRPPQRGRLIFPDEAKFQAIYPVMLTSEPSVVAGIFQGVEIDPQAVFSPSAPASIRPLGKSARLKTSMQGPKQVTQNVIGVLDGTDPQLKSQYVLFSAHLDHVQSTGTEIYNGADDDASGVSAVLEIAQAFALGPPPRRSILVIFHTGEEEGLLGSKYFVQHPTVPLQSIVTDLNIDMIGRSRHPGDTNPANNELSDANTIFLIGSDKLSQDLHELSEQTNQDTVKLKLDYRYNSEDHPQRLYYRSDHWNYAKNGIPVIFYFTGLHEDYHRPTDDVEKLDFEKMARVTQLIFTTGWRLANIDQRVKLNSPSQ